MSEIMDLSINKIVAIAIAGSNSWVYTWFKDPQVAIAGSSTILGKRSNAYYYNLPLKVDASALIGVGIAKLDIDKDQCYAWYSNKMTTRGKTSDLDRYTSLRNYELPDNKKPENVVGIGISKKDLVYTWFDDNTRTYGTSRNLGKYSSSGGKQYLLAFKPILNEEGLIIGYSEERYSPEQVIGIANAPNDWCYA
jgi:hypothetical protein